MLAFWADVIAPVLDAVQARTVIEIGALRGRTTTQLLGRLGSDAELHVIDPEPLFDPAEHEAEFPGRYVFHRDISLNVLPNLPAADAALIDGDHNWYTVYNELKLLAGAAGEAGKPLPVIMMHDVCWPYGRRDLYYAPERIPAEFRQPYARRGMKKGQKRLRARGGLNPRLDNALVEGGPRNGVATALDDFLAEYGPAVRQVVIPIRFGLAIVVEESRLSREPAVAALLDSLEGTERQQRLLAVAEDLYVNSATAYHGLAFNLKTDSKRAVTRYLKLLKTALLDEHYLENEVRVNYLATCARNGTAPEPQRLRDPAKFMPRELARVRASRRVGRLADDGNSRYHHVPYTTMGRVRLDHLTRCLDTIRRERVAGDLVECGTGRGGGAIYMRGYLDAHEVMDTRVWVADTFRPSPADGEATPSVDRSLRPIRADLNAVREGFARFDLLDERVRFLQGPFGDTLQDAPIETVALLRLGDGLDGSPDVVLDKLYDKLAIGGFVVIEDYATPDQRAAVEAFRDRRAVDEPIEQVDTAGVSWRKTVQRPASAGAAPAEHLRRPPLVRPVLATKDPLDLTVVAVFYNMRREAERTLHSLSRAYQEGVEQIDYEVIAVENGSAPDQELGEDFVRSFGPEFQYLNLGAESTPSPAPALNRGIAAGRGGAFALMIDGAHLLTPGVLHFGMTGLATYRPSIVTTVRWYVGPGQQHEHVDDGYDKNYEDRLFRRIGWPSRGYALFGIGHFLGDRDWFDATGESNCLFVPRPLLEQVGALDESFSTPGGGFANLELYERLGSSPDITLATIIGEGSFHQLHGGTTTNSEDPVARRRLISAYRREYLEMRGKDFKGPVKEPHFVGHLPQGAARTRARRRGRSKAERAATSENPNALPQTPALIADDVKLEFTDAFWHSLTWQETRWLGRRVPKSPVDLIAYQELIVRLRPDWIVETRAGTASLAPFFASICELVGHGQVLSVGPEALEDSPASDARLTTLIADPVEDAAVATVRGLVGPTSSALVVLGSRGTRARTLEEFARYSPLVPVDGYLVVEDTVLGGRPVWPEFGPGPGHAVNAILADRDDFQPDRSLERYGATFNLGGYLQRLSP